MQNEPMSEPGRVVYLRPSDARLAQLRRWGWACRDAVGGVVSFLARMLWGVVWFAILMARMVLAAFLVLIEPLVAILLVPFAFLGTLVALFVGFVGQAPGFPKCGVLGLSVGALCLYWLFIALIVLVTGGRRGH